MIQTKSLDETIELGERIGERLKGGEIIELVSDLGGGKTQLARGLAKGMGSKDLVQSPSFTISRIYRASKLELHHFDFHRLDDPGIVRLQLAEVIGQPGIVVAIEWADRVQDVLPADRLVIEIKVSGEQGRQLNVRSTGPAHEHLIEGLK